MCKTHVMNQGLLLGLGVICLLGYLVYQHFNGYDILLKEGLYKVDGCDKNFMNYGYWKDSSTTTLQSASKKLVKKLISKNKDALKNASKILDIGCGRGKQDIILTNHTSGNIVGIDIDPANISTCIELAKKHKMQDQLSFITGDACELPFDDNSFDVVLSLESAFHYPSREKFIREVKRVLKPGGKFMLGDILINKKSNIVYCMQKYICSYLNVVNICDKDINTLETTLEDNGFRYDIKDITKDTFVPFYNNFISNYNHNVAYSILTKVGINFLLYAQKYTNMFSYVIVSCDIPMLDLDKKNPDKKNPDKKESLSKIEELV